MKERETIIDTILKNVRLHQWLIRNWAESLGSSISFAFEYGEDIEKDPDNLFPVLEKRFLNVKSQTLKEGLLTGLWDGSLSICWNHEGNAACTDEEQNARDEEIYNSAKKYYDKYYSILLDIAEEGRGFDCENGYAVISAVLDSNDDSMIIMRVEYSVNGETFTDSCVICDDTIESLCRWENFELDEQEEFCYNIADQYDDDHRLFSFAAEKKGSDIDVTITVYNGEEKHDFRKCMSRVEYYKFVNFFDIIRSVLFDSRRYWL